MELSRRTVFESELLCIRHLVARPDSAACGEIESAAVDQLVLPVAGVFARHEGPARQVIANASHALLFAADQPYRISYPGCVGDEVLVFEFRPSTLSSALADTVAADDLRSPSLARDGLLPPSAQLQRSLLWHRLRLGDAQALAVEDASLALLAGVLYALGAEPGREDRAHRHGTAARRHRQIASVKEAISVRPEHPWTLDALARLAHTTPFHLSRLFRKDVGTPIHQYVVRARLAKGLQAVLDAGSDLTTIALDSGFASHSHFTASFRALFGLTPTQWRRQASGEQAMQMRKAAIA